MSAKPKNQITDFSALSNAVAALGDAIQSRMAKREALCQQRDAIAALPMHRDDLIAAVCEWVDSVRPLYLKHLGTVVGPLSRRPDRPLPDARHGDFGLVASDNKVMAYPILVLLAPALKDALGKAIAELDLPDQDALPANERLALLESLDSQIEALDAELADLHQQAESAGLAPIRRRPTPEEIQRLFANGAPTKPEDIALAAENLERSLNGEPPLKRPTPPAKVEMIKDADLPNDF